MGHNLTRENQDFLLRYVRAESGISEHGALPVHVTRDVFADARKLPRFGAFGDNPGCPITQSKISLLRTLPNI